MYQAGETADDCQHRLNKYKSNDRKYLDKYPCIKEHILKILMMMVMVVFQKKIQQYFLTKLTSGKREIIIGSKHLILWYLGVFGTLPAINI